MKTIFTNASSSLLFILFTYTAISKLADYDHFRYTLSTSYYTGKFASTLVWSLPIGELLVSGLLLFRKTRVWGLYGSFILMTTFTCYIIFMLSYDQHLPCSCGGVIKQMSWKAHLYFNIVFTIISLSALLLEKTRRMTGNNYSGNTIMRQ